MGALVVLLGVLTIVFSLTRLAASASDGGTPAPPSSARATSPATSASASASAPAPAATAEGEKGEKGAKKAKPVFQKATVGIYLRQIPEVDVRTNTFSADFYLWLLWSGEENLAETLEFANVFAPSELSKVATYVEDGKETPEILPDGRKYQVYRVHGRFHQAFSLANYPLDSQRIEIEVEDAKHPISELVFEIDKKGTKRAADVEVPGWALSPLDGVTSTTVFDTTFGEPSAVNKESYSRASFALTITRPSAGLLAKTVLPIVLVIAITFGAFFCKPEDIDARLCLTITALISAVALQYSSSTDLPPLGYLVLLDKVYILSYVVILLGTFASILANRLATAEKAQAAATVDRVALIGLVGLFFVGTTLILTVH